MPQISINIPTAAVPRLKAALRRFFAEGIDPETGLPYPEPTDAEYVAKLKEFIKEYVSREITDWERRTAVRDAEDGILPFDVED